MKKLLAFLGLPALVLLAITELFLAYISWLEPPSYEVSNTHAQTFGGIKHSHFRNHIIYSIAIDHQIHLNEQLEDKVSLILTNSKQL